MKTKAIVLDVGITIFVLPAMFLFLFGLMVTVFGQTVEYTVQDLGVLEEGNYSVARSINNNGEVAGLGYITGGYRAFRYADSSGIENLGSPPGTNIADGWDINNDRTVASAGGADPYIYTDADGWRYLGSLGGDGGEARGINDNGIVTGFSYTSGSNNPHAFIFDSNADPGSMIDIIPDISTSYGRDINNAGQVTGYMLSGGFRAFRWTDGDVQNLGVLPGMAHSFGYAVNESGQVTGYSSSASGNAAKIFRYTDGVGMEDLGGLGEDNAGWGINSRGDVVGRGNPGAGFEVAVIYTDEDGLRNLNDLIDSSSGWFLSWAFDINDAGQIVGVGSNRFGDAHAVRLDPISTGIEPSRDEIPNRIALVQNYPNPFNASTSIMYSLTSPARVKLQIYDVLGRKIAVLADGYEEAGEHRAVWNASSQPSGVYFYMLVADGRSEVRRMALLK